MAQKILIIDDEREIQLYLKALFKKAGFETRVASDGVEGVAQAKAFGPDLIVMDILMPRQSGVVAYEQLCALDETREIPIVILTGLAEREHLFASRAAQLPRPAAVVEKPIDRQAFLQQIKGLLGAEE